MDEKRQMLELLKRFEEESTENSDGEEEEDMDGLAFRIEGIDLGVFCKLCACTS